MRVARSLRGRLLLAGFLGALVAAAVGTFVIGAVFERAVERAALRRLETELGALVGLAETDAQGRWSLASEPARAEYRRIFSGSYWLVEGGGESRRSRSWWDATAQLPAATPKPTHALVAGPRGQQLFVVQQLVRLPRSASRVRFVVAEDRAPVVQEAREFRRFVALAQLGLGGLLFALVAYQVHFGLRPLKELSRRLGDVRAGHRGRIGDADLPEEVSPLAAELDALLASHEGNVDRVRRNTADLAHALKTPLAVLAAAAERPPGDLPQLLQHEVARMQRVVERRLSAGGAADARSRADVPTVLLALAALMRRAHATRDLVVRVEPPAESTFAGAAEDLEEMVGNLMDNACKWARSRVEVAVIAAGDRLVIDIRDDGAGLEEAQIAAVLQRGVRLDEVVEGSGLGLGICADLAEAYGGALALDRAPGLGGVRALLELPRAPDHALDGRQRRDGNPALRPR